MKTVHISLYPGQYVKFLWPDHSLESKLHPGPVNLDGQLFSLRKEQCPISNSLDIIVFNNSFPYSVDVFLYWARNFFFPWVAWNWVKKIALTCLLWVNKLQNYPISPNPWEVIISGPVTLGSEVVLKCCVYRARGRRRGRTREHETSPNPYWPKSYF